MARSTARATWGITQKNTVAWMGKIPRCLAEHRDLILIHDLGNSLRIQVTLAVCCDREIIENDSAIPSGNRHKVMLPLLSQARRMAHLLSGAEALKVGGEQPDR